MTTMQQIGLGVGLFIALARLPGLVWPVPYRDKVLSLLERYPAALRGIGVLLWPVAIAILTLVAGTLTVLQIVMLVVAVVFVAVGVVMVFFPEAYRKLAETVLRGLPPVGVRFLSAVAVVIGLWIVYLSLSVR